MTRPATAEPGAARCSRPLTTGTVVVVVLALATALAGGRPLFPAVLAVPLLALVLRPDLVLGGPGRADRPVAAIIGGAALATALLVPVLPAPAVVPILLVVVGGFAVAQVAAVVLLVRRQVHGTPTQGPPEPLPDLSSDEGHELSGHGELDRALAASVVAVVAVSAWFPPADPGSWVPAALYVGAVAPVRVWWVNRGRG